MYHFVTRRNAILNTIGGSHTLISRSAKPHELLIPNVIQETIALLTSLQPLYHEDSNGLIRQVRIAHNFHIMNRLELESTPIEVFAFTKSPSDIQGSGRNFTTLIIMKGYNYTYISGYSMSFNQLVSMAKKSAISNFAEYNCNICKEKTIDNGCICEYCGNSLIEEKINKYSRFIVKKESLKNFIPPMLYSYVYQMQEMAGLDRRMGVKL